MNNILQKIIKHKETEVAALKHQLKSTEISVRVSDKSFKDSLLQNGLSVIAEIKRKSPSKGELAKITNPIELALDYVQGGANTISVLTDSYFGGTSHDLEAVASALKGTSVTVLRKDFIIDPIQIDEAIMLGADALLLIVAVLEVRLETLLQYAKAKNIAALVEVHNLAELEIAVVAGAEIIGVNNRDLTTFEVDVTNSLELIAQIPSHIITVSESGIDSVAVAQQIYGAGFDAVLVGEALVTSQNPSGFIQQMREASSDPSFPRRRESSSAPSYRGLTAVSSTCKVFLDPAIKSRDDIVKSRDDIVKSRDDSNVGRLRDDALVKICGIKDPETAVTAAKLGADFIGMIFYEKSKRNISLETAKKICEALETTNAKPVGVFVDQSASEIADICQATGIEIVQLHGKTSKNDAHKLLRHIQRIYVIAVDYSGKIHDANNQANIKQLDKARDYLLFDGNCPGSGRTFPLTEFTNKYDFPFFLSGGLNAGNVQTAIKMIYPNGVDVATGVENAGEKDKNLINQFINLVKATEEE